MNKQLLGTKNPGLKSDHIEPVEVKNKHYLTASRTLDGMLCLMTDAEAKRWADQCAAEERRIRAEYPKQFPALMLDEGRVDRAVSGWMRGQRIYIADMVLKGA